MIRHSLATASVVALLVSLVACGNDETDDAATTVSPVTAAEERAEVVIERDLAYATYHGLTLTLDLYLPADPSDAPIVIEPWESFAEQIAQQGALSILGRTGIPDPETGDPQEARLSDHGALIRAEAEQAACAIRFARARAAELGNDDPIVVIGGFSAYGGVSAHVALLGASLEESWDEFAAGSDGPTRQVECAVVDGSTHVDALVSSAGAYELYVPAFEGLYGRA